MIDPETHFEILKTTNNSSAPYRLVFNGQILPVCFEDENTAYLFGLAKRMSKRFYPKMEPQRIIYQADIIKELASLSEGLGR